MIKFLTLAFVVLVVAACGQRPSPTQVVQSLEPSVVADGLRAGDRVRVTVAGQDDLTGPYDVTPAGTVELPLVGAIQAADRSVDDLAEAITVALADGYLRDPTVNVAQIAQHPFFIQGAISRPGSYPFRANLTFANAIEQAGGSAGGAPTEIVVKRGGRRGEQVTVRDDDLVNPGDIIELRSLAS